MKHESEEVLEPDLEICDPHHHLGNRFTPPYLMEELESDIRSGHRVTSTVYIENREHHRADGPVELRPVGETEWVASMPRTTNAIEGIVGFADLRLGDAVEEVVSAHVQAGQGRFRGIRHCSAWDPHPELSHSQKAVLYSLSEFSRGVGSLGRLGFTFDALCYFHKLEEVADLAKANPDTIIVLNHLGGPLGIGPYADDLSQARTVWRRGLGHVAKSENVRLKLGGIGMGRFGFSWPDRPSSEDIAVAAGPLFRECIELFGVDRCMFESNFPADAPLCDYTSLWNAFKLMSADFKPDERAALFHNTAARTYRLGPWSPQARRP